MKNLLFASTIFVALIIVLTRQANAQLVVSGSAGFSTISDKIDGSRQSDAFNFEVCPSVGYMMEKWEFGVSFEYAYNKIKFSGTESRTETESYYAVGPYADYTFANVGKVYFTIEGSSMFGFADGEHSIDIQLLPVATLEINDHWDFDVYSDILSLNYVWTKTDDDDHTVGKFDFLANSGRVLALGFTYKF